MASGQTSDRIMAGIPLRHRVLVVLLYRSVFHSFNICCHASTSFLSLLAFSALPTDRDDDAMVNLKLLPPLAGVARREELLLLGMFDRSGVAKADERVDRTSEALLLVITPSLPRK